MMHDVDDDDDDHDSNYRRKLRMKQTSISQPDCR